MVSEVPGHSSIAFTLGIYSHVIRGMQEAAAKAMEDVLEAYHGIERSQ
jgi:hypothetical protein